MGVLIYRFRGWQQPVCATQVLQMATRGRRLTGTGQGDDFVANPRGARRNSTKPG